uniref:DUF834 domain-containing protein n=1 Tax=Oryza nivara TaxID=4536 RepID=A0A0E0GIL5_ORYNI
MGRRESEEGERRGYREGTGRREERTTARNVIVLAEEGDEAGARSSRHASTNAPAPPARSATDGDSETTMVCDSGRE